MEGFVWKTIIASIFFQTLFLTSEGKLNNIKILGKMHANIQEKISSI